MPIKPELKPLYGDDWPEISASIRFGRAGGKCENCRRKHGELYEGRVTRVWLACAHVTHDPRERAPHLLKALCQRCHLSHDAPEHRRRRWLTYRRRRALGDLFLGPYAVMI